LVHRLQITHSGIDTTKGPAGWFTGDVLIAYLGREPPFAAEGVPHR
jgi:hypothetical protein